MRKEQRLLFNIDYPSEKSPLYSNINVASGWCFHTSEPIYAIRLFVNKDFESEGILKYPRLDVASKYPDHGESSLLCGFTCYFNFAKLSMGENLFDFHVYTKHSQERISKVVVKHGEPASQKVNDVFVDISGVCNLRCAMCPQGILEKAARERDIGMMSVELFNHAMSFLLERGFMSEYVNLYNWGDPLLHPQLGKILDICRSKNIKTIVSTNLSVPTERLSPIKYHHVDLLIVSISGFSEQTYARNHVGGDFKLVRRNLESLKNQGAAIKEIVVKYLVFNYNRDELELARSFCKEHGFQFGAYAGAIPCVESFFRYIDDCDYRRKVEEFLALEQINLQPARFCPEETAITLNHKAELEQCCVSWNSGYGLSVFDADIREYLDRKAENEFCGKCLSSGFSHYKHFGTMSPLMLSAALYPSLAAQRSYTKTDLDEKMSLLSE